MIFVRKRKERKERINIVGVFLLNILNVAIELVLCCCISWSATLRRVALLLKEVSPAFFYSTLKSLVVEVCLLHRLLVRVHYDC